jgi:Sel1 repeat-containing protein
LRCGQCGNENAEANRFCGMCGAPLPAKEQAAAPAPAAVSAEVRADAGASAGPVITGPSFLGLGTPAGGTGSGRGAAQGDRQADRARDALRPSANVDYLLEDDEEPRRSRGKFILVVLALGLAMGFGYLHWKRGGFDWLTAGEKKPSAAAAPAPDAAQGDADSAAKGTSAASGAAAQTGANAPAPGAGAGTPAESGAPQTNAAQTSSQAAPAQSNPGRSAPASDSPAPAAAPSSTGQQSAPQNSASDSSATAASTQAADSDSGKQSIPAEAAPKPVARKPAAAKPSAAKPAAAKPVESVAEAERYIYGRGVTQDCDRGLRLLKPATESNAQAMISMGVMYTTGTCTPRDLPTAYRWFALALHKEPDNQALQEDLQKLWGQMTPPERQLAIKLSQ